MGIWDSILKYGGKAAKATGRSMGHAALHPSQTLRGTEPKASERAESTSEPFL